MMVSQFMTHLPDGVRWLCHLTALIDALIDNFMTEFGKFSQNDGKIVYY